VFHPPALRDSLLPPQNEDEARSSLGIDIPLVITHQLLVKVLVSVGARKEDGKGTLLLTVLAAKTEN